MKAKRMTTYRVEQSPLNNKHYIIRKDGAVWFVLEVNHEDDLPKVFAIVDALNN